MSQELVEPLEWKSYKEWRWCKNAEQQRSCGQETWRSNRRGMKKANSEWPIQWLQSTSVPWKYTALVLWMVGSPYALWYVVQGSLPSIYKDVYHFHELQIGLLDLPGGFGTVSGGYLNEEFMEWNRKATARSIGHIIDKVSGDDVKKIPIERARARGSYCLLIVFIATLAGYG